MATPPNDLIDVDSGITPPDDLMDVEGDHLPLTFDSNTATPPAQQFQRTPAPGFINYNAGVGIPEAVLNYGTGLVGQVASGYRGLYGLATGESLEQSAQNVQKWQQALTYQPRTKAGQVISEYNPLALTGRGIQWLEGKAGEATQQAFSDVGASPEVSAGAATVADVGTQAIATLLTGKVAPPVVRGVIKAGEKVAPPVVRGVIKAGEKVATKIPFTEARMQAKVNQQIATALNNDPVMMQRASDLFGQGLSLEQVAVQLQSPGLASLSRSALRETQTLAQPRAAQIEQERVRNLTAAEQQVNQLRQQTQAQADLAPTQVNALLEQEKARKQAVEQAALERQQQAVAAQTEQQAAVGRAIPETEQPAVGAEILKQRKAQLEGAKETSKKEYESVWELDKGNEFSLDPLSRTAEAINADVATALEPSLAPNTAKILQKFRTKPGSYDSLYNTWRKGTPATVSLKDAHGIMKDINRDLAALEGSIDPKANVQRDNLMQLKSSLEQAIKQGSSPEAFAAYKNAQTNYLKYVIEPYRKGWVANLERQGATGESILAPSKVTSTILSKFENTQKFLSTFGDNPVAMDSVRGGIVDIYRSKVALGGEFNPKAHAKFMETYKAQIDALDKKGMGLREQLNSYAEQHGAAARTAEQVKTETKATLESSEAIAAENKAKIAEFKRQLNSKNAEDKAVVNEVEKIYNDAKNSRLSDPDYTPGESEFASVQRMNDLANQVPGLKAELDRLYYSEQYQQLAKQGEELGIGFKKKGAAAETEPTLVKAGVKTIVAAKAPIIPAFKFAYDSVASYIKSKLGKSNAALAARIAEELVNRPSAAISKAKTTVKAPTNALSNRQSTNALRPQ